MNTETVLDLATLVGPMPDIPCDEIADMPPHSADWYATCRACGHTIALCDDYIQWTQAQQEAKNVDTFHCPKCYTYTQTWNELVALTPLEKR